MCNYWDIVNIQLTNDLYYLISKNDIFSYNPERKKQFWEFESFGHSNGSCFTSIAFYANGIFTLDVQKFNAYKWENFKQK